MGLINSVIIKAPADKVWDRVKNFHDMSWCSNVITKLEKEGDKDAYEIGAKRYLNDAIHETLLAFDNEAKRYSYSIDDGPGPVSNDNMSGYVSSVTIYPVTENDTSLVMLEAKWESDKEGSVPDFCNPIYQAMLQDLKSRFE